MGHLQVLRVRHVVYPAVCALHLLFAVSGRSAPAWVATYSNSPDSYDVAENIVLGRDGSVYVSGFPFSFGEEPQKAAIVKYSSTGQEFWAAENTNISRVSVTGRLPLTALDFGGGVRLAGNWTEATNEIGVVSYSSGGNLRWERRFLEGLESHPHAVAVDGASNTIVVGWSRSGAAADALVLRYAPDGTLLWSRNYSQSLPSEERAYSVATLPNRDILVGIDGERRGPIVVKYSRDGQLLWIAEPGGQGFPGQMKVDTTGNIIIARVGEWVPTTLIKLNANGKVLWETEPDLAIRHIAVDSENNIYAAGTSLLEGGVVVAKYDTNGVREWTSQFSEFHLFMTAPAGIATYQGGLSIGLTINDDILNRFTVAHFNRDGVEVWRGADYENSGHVQAMVGDTNGGIYLAGTSDFPYSTDFQTMKFQVASTPRRPTIIVPPRDLVVVAGTNRAVFSVEAGNGPNTFQWRWNGYEIPGATKATLVLTNIGSGYSHAEVYSVIVRNSYGYVVSPDARLIVREPPAIYWQSPLQTNETAVAGNQLHLPTFVLGEPPITFSWYRNGVLLGQTNSAFVLEQLAMGDAGTYTVIARNPYGATTNTPFTLRVVERTRIDDWRWVKPRPQGNGLGSVTFGNGRFVAVGGHGTMLNSTDGTTWTVTNLNRFDLCGVAFGNGTFVAVSTLGAVYTSPDGLAWTQRRRDSTLEQQVPGTDSMSEEQFAGLGFLNQRFVTWGFRVRSSVDGRNWIDHGPSPEAYRGIVFGEGKYVMPGRGYNMISTNLSDWKMHILSHKDDDLSGAVYGNGVFVMDAGWELYTSPDGTEVTSRHPVSYGTAVCFANGRFFTLGETREISEDGVTWTPVADGSYRSLSSIAYGNGRYVAVGSFGAMATSSDGLTWTGEARGFADMRGLAYGNGRYVAVGERETWSSVDGEVWSPVIGPAADSPAAITWANGTFVVVGVRGELLTSKDGTTWVRVVLTTNDLRAVIHDGTRFVVAGEQTILLSTDGIQWQQIVSPELRGARALAFGGGIYLLSRHAVLDDGIKISTNAVDWTSAPSGPSVSSLAYGNGRFVGVNRSASVSTNGFSWSYHLISPNDAFEPGFESVVFANGMFVASSRSGSQQERIVATSTNGQQWVVHRTHAVVPSARISYANGAFWLAGQYQAILRSPQIEPALRARKTGAGVELTVQAYPGQSYRLQRGTALGEWNDFQTFTPQAERTTLIDNDAGLTGAFYRIVGP
jgi:hypothetical protein